MSSGASWKKKDEKRNCPDPAPDKGDVWIWHAVDVRSRLRIANHISKVRHVEDAKPLLAQTVERLSDERILFLSDELKAYLDALLDVVGIHVPERKVLVLGRPRKAHKEFPEGLLYGQISKDREHGHLVCVRRKAVVGSIEEIDAALVRDGQCKVINTSRVERDNLSVRQHLGRVVRKTLSYSKDWQMHKAAIDFEDAVHNFARTHLALRLPVNGPGTRRWLQRTPAMAAGLTDHIWSIRELVSYRLPSRY